MRVLHILDHSIPLQSGYTFRTRAILREQRRLGWDTHQLTSPKHTAAGPLDETVDGLLFHRTRGPGWPASVPVLGELALMKATTERLHELARAIRPDVLHAHSPVLNAIPALRVGRRLGIPVVYEVRAFWEDAAVDHGTSREDGLRYRATRALETWALKRADHVTAICEGLRADIAARGIAADDITVIPNAVDVDAFTFGAVPDAELKKQLGLDGATVIGFIGSFYAYEGLDLLIDALPAVLAQRPEARVLLVGGGPQEAALRRQVVERGMQDRVLFTGRIPHGDVQRYYSVVDVFAYPRHSMRLTELVTPLKPLEAMAQGHLLVASDVGGHRELIKDGETGVLFKAGDASALAAALLGLLAHPTRWPALRANGRGHVEATRNWATSVHGYERAYARAMQRAVVVVSGDPG